MKPVISALDHLVLTARDLHVTRRFYEDVLGMVAQVFVTPSGEDRYALSFGVQKINLHQEGAEFAPHAKVPMAGALDLCFVSETPLSDWQGHLSLFGVDIIDGPVQRTGAQGPITSIYIADPDGNLIEIANRISSQ
ncbi:MAG: VOC family protein [Halocynthiibacter sp.]